jgi:hypothetical protein
MIKIILSHLACIRLENPMTPAFKKITPAKVKMNFEAMIKIEFNGV